MLKSFNELIVRCLQTLFDCIGVIQVDLLGGVKILLDFFQQIYVFLSELKLILHVVEELVVLIMVCISLIPLMYHVILHLIDFLYVFLVQHILLL